MAYGKRKILPLTLLINFLTALPAIAQDNGIEMADLMHSNGKIYVVVAVVAVILAGLLVFLMIIDKRVRKLEKEKRKE